jgi:hypothetical protein
MDKTWDWQPLTEAACDSSSIEKSACTLMTLITLQTVVYYDRQLPIRALPNKIHST